MTDRTARATEERILRSAQDDNAPGITDRKAKATESRSFAPLRMTMLRITNRKA
jgi:hypothetical protein